MEKRHVVQTIVALAGGLLAKVLTSPTRKTPVVPPPSVKNGLKEIRSAIQNDIEKVYERSIQ